MRESKHELLCQRHITTARGVLQSQPAKSLSVAELIELRAVCTIQKSFQDLNFSVDIHQTKLHAFWTNTYK